MQTYALTDEEFNALVDERNRVGLVFALAAAVPNGSGGFGLKADEFCSFVSSVYGSLDSAVKAAEGRRQTAQEMKPGLGVLSAFDIVALIKTSHEGGTSKYPIGDLLPRLRSAAEADPDMQLVRDAWDAAISDRGLDSRQERVAHA